jgi:hypothetical protein
MPCLLVPYRTTRTPIISVPDVSAPKLSIWYLSCCGVRNATTCCRRGLMRLQYRYTSTGQQSGIECFVPSSGFKMVHCIFIICFEQEQSTYIHYTYIRRINASFPPNAHVSVKKPNSAEKKLSVRARVSAGRNCILAFSIVALASHQSSLRRLS